MRNLVLLLSSVCISNLFAQGGMPIQPDETPYLLAPKSWQLENGLLVQKTAENKLYTSAILVKYGWLEQLEFRAIVAAERVEDATQKHHFHPLVLGAKFHLFSEKKVVPATAMYLQAALPDWHLGNFSPEIGLQSQGNYGRWISINYNFALHWETFNLPVLYKYKLTNSVNISNQWCYYAEILGTLQNHNLPEHAINNGLMYFFSDRAVVDISAGKGITAIAPQWFAAVTFSIRK